MDNVCTSDQDSWDSSRVAKEVGVIKGCRGSVIRDFDRVDLDEH